MSVVLADDHRMIREGLRRSMEDNGLRVLGEAADGEQAVEMASALRPDVVLMDVSMPVLDGIDATRRLRASAPEVAVVMLTMHADHDVIARAMRAGAVGYLVKDCSVDEVVSTVRLAAAGETALTAELASSVLAEVREPDQHRLVSPREEEVLQMIADGYSTPDVAKRLFISQKTVKNHLASVYDKLDARDRTQAILRAVRMRIVKLG